MYNKMYDEVIVNGKCIKYMVVGLEVGYRDKWLHQTVL
jgi:hypothetical protein